MNETNAIRLWLLGQACVARIEGMKALNEARILHGNSPGYSEEAFCAEADALEKLAAETLESPPASAESGACGCVCDVAPDGTRGYTMRCRAHAPRRSEGEGGKP